MARIGIDYTAAIYQQAGIGRYVRELVAALADSAGEQDDKFVLFVAGTRGDRPPAPSGCRYAPSILSERTHARVWHRLKLPLPVELWTGRVDAFHATDFTLPRTRPLTRTVLTIHDLAFEKYPDETMPGMLDFLRSAVPESAQRADHIIAVSEATRRDVIDMYSVPAEKVTAIAHGVSTPYSPVVSGRETAVRDNYRLRDGPFVLTVGTLQPRKNHLRLVQAFARVRSDASLVIAGGKGWHYAAVRSEVERLNLGERVIFTGFVADADLPDLYRAATVFAYPALYEGFGLPALEAMACGVPVVASNTSSLPEVVGEAGLLVDPMDVDALADAISHVLEDSALRADLRDKALARAKQFTWQHTAEMTRQVYRNLLNDAPG